MAEVTGGAVYNVCTTPDILQEFLLSYLSFTVNMFFDSSKYLKEKFEDTKGVIRIRKSKNDRSHYDKKIKKKEKQ